jgi:uncharacterized membrane protein
LLPVPQLFKRFDYAQRTYVAEALGLSVFEALVLSVFEALVLSVVEALVLSVVEAKMTQHKRTTQ